MNKVILMGRLTKDVEMRQTPNGVAVANNKRNYKYIEAILRNHYNAGRTTMAQVIDSNRAFKAQGKQGLDVYDDSHINYDELEKMMRESM